MSYWRPARIFFIYGLGHIMLTNESLIQVLTGYPIYLQMRQSFTELAHPGPWVPLLQSSSFHHSVPKGSCRGWWNLFSFFTILHLIF
jgi:hypothetical protein